MNTQRTAQASRTRRIARTRAKIAGTAARPRLAVRRTLQHIYAQLIDDAAGRTLVAASDLDLGTEATKGKRKTDRAQAVGALIAERAAAKGITAAVFDRRDKKYHGRVKALADGARAGGLNF
ncbi:50S ribosomal protein L18 [Candidatus Uhrbacteria bacterium]|nr:50S ribosomal protein L18 [Candidatus Uhrbacteria bacterium]